jgi:hypothetical protein
VKPVRPETIGPRPWRAPRWALPVGFFLLGVLAGLAAFTLITRPTGRVIAQWQKPDHVAYDGGTYYLSVMEGGMDLATFPFERRRTYYLVVSSQKVPRPDDRRVDFTFYPPTELLNNVPTFIAMSQVEWATDGVTFAPANSQLLFLPSWIFTGRR